MRIPRINIINFLLTAVLVLSLFLRTYNTNWDNGTHQHPDERAIIMYALPLDFPKGLDEFLSPESPLNPNFFAYGNLPLYILKSVSVLAGEFNPSLASYDGINILGRLLAAIIDTATVFLVFRIGALLFNKKGALWGALIYTLSVFAIQNSHFFTVDTFLTFFVTLTIYRLLKFYKNPTITNSIFVGLAFGFALSTKISALPLIFAVGFTLSVEFLIIFLSKPHHFTHWFPHIPKLLKNLATNGAIILSVTFLTFIITQPYAVIDFTDFYEQNLLQSQMTHNAYIFPYTLQYVGKLPIFHELKNIFLWGQGLFISFLCFGGILYILFNIKRLERDLQAEILIILSFTIVFFLVVANFAVGWMRYLLPIYPILSILGGYSVLKVTDFIGRKKLLKFIIISIFLLLLFAWPISFLRIYSSPHTRIEATNWINNNIPEGSTIAVEHWDDRLPLYTTREFSFVELGLYEVPDDENKIQRIYTQIENSDFIILASNRLFAPLQRITDCRRFKKCYPNTSIYYEKLFAEKLGFVKVAEFTSFPTIPLLNLKINDQAADESFTVYDHPQVFIFKNTRL